MDEQDRQLIIENERFDDDGAPPMLDEPDPDEAVRTE
jgi:hypothetical protein